MVSKRTSTWKVVEKKIAKYLSEIFAQRGFSPVVRIPILGREGPDISLNELKLVIDVKHRQQNPKLYKIDGHYVYKFGNLTGCRIEDFWLLIDLPDKWTDRHPGSVLVGQWFSHMKKHCDDQYPDGVPAIVLHHIGGHMKDSVILVDDEGRRKLHDNCNNGK